MASSGPHQRDWGKIILAVSVFMLVVAGILWMFMPFLGWTEQRQAGEDVVKQEVDAESAIQDYEWFRTQSGYIEAQRNQVQNHYDEEEQFHETYGNDPNEWSRTAETRHGRIHDRITASQNQLENLVSDYNARSKMANRAMFKCHLPYKVDERFAITGPPGSGSPEQPNDTYVDGADPTKEPPEPEQCDGLPKKESSGS